MIHIINDRERELACVISDLKTENSKLREAAKLGLESIEYTIKTEPEWFDVDKAELLSHRAINALNEALWKQA